MNDEADAMVLSLYEALSELSLGVDEVRRSLEREPAPMQRLGELARETRPLLDVACTHLMRTGYRWDGRRFVR